MYKIFVSDVSESDYNYKAVTLAVEITTIFSENPIVVARVCPITVVRVSFENTFMVVRVCSGKDNSGMNQEVFQTTQKTQGATTLIPLRRIPDSDMPCLVPWPGRYIQTEAVNGTAVLDMKK